MARSVSNLLDTDDLFPSLTLQTIFGVSLELPNDCGTGYSVFLIYRGYW